MGVPPLVGVAVNVADAPLQIVVEGVLILTEVAGPGLMVIPTWLDVIVVEVAHAALLVSTTLTCAPLVRVLLL